MTFLHELLDLFTKLVDIALHLDAHLNEWAAVLGPWLYVVLFLVIFCETGLVITPYLPGDSLLFAVGALAAREGSPLQIFHVLVLLSVAAILGDTVIGYITQGRGISIHKKECLNAHRFSNMNRIIDVQWDQNAILFFSTDLKIVAHDQTKILNDLAALFANEKIDLLHFNSLFNKNQNIIIITITIQVQNKAQLQQQLRRISQLPGVIEVKRL